ncbi:hypothetical protein NDK43_05515 [Neobacillus pocheonensis]|uniref:Spore coat protein n=1 Tax=Neobacillus pocheonensis TaxID=363869 RepID=A0ABT0W6I6_9BACI|nr:hypothetical protein [Neobacillus pocheonensis]
MVGYQQKHENYIVQSFEKILEEDVVIPFTLLTTKGELFSVVTSNQFFEDVNTPVFTLKILDKKKGLIVLNSLIPIDMEGCPVDLGPDLYSLILTNTCFTMKINCFSEIVPLPSDLIDKYIPIIESKY